MTELTFVDDEGERVELEAEDARTLCEATDGLDAATVSACPDCRSRVRRRGRAGRHPRGRPTPRPRRRPGRAGRGRADPAPLRRRRLGALRPPRLARSRATRSGSRRCHRRTPPAATRRPTATRVRLLDGEAGHVVVEAGAQPFGECATDRLAGHLERHGVHGLGQLVRDLAGARLDRPPSPRPRRGTRPRPPPSASTSVACCTQRVNHALARPVAAQLDAERRHRHPDRHLVEPDLERCPRRRPGSRRWW